MNKQLSFKRDGKQWVHPSETLIKGQVVYNVKFLGHVEVDQPKGSEMVRDAIRKMKFSRQIKKAEGEKPMKVELNISMDAIKIQEPKYKVVQYQYPLHLVSYCADDKSDKRMFTFIAKEKESTKHHCFVFDSEKSAEEITLTVGQAFDLAYRRFLESSNKGIDSKKQLLSLQKKVEELTNENSTLKQRVALLEKMVDAKQLNDGLNGKNTIAEPFVGRRLENLVLSPTTMMTQSSNQKTTNGNYGGTSPLSPSSRDIPILAPPPPIPNRSFNAEQTRRHGVDIDLFGSQPFAIDNRHNDVFGMETFSPTFNSSFELDQEIQTMDKELLDVQENFRRGLSFGTEDFSLDDLDPLKFI